MEGIDVMATTAIISKGELFELMGMEAFQFAIWMNGADSMSMATKTIFTSLQEINLASPMIQYILLPLLLEQGILTQNTINNINARKDELLAL
jgi:hypothetical protein